MNTKTYYCGEERGEIVCVNCAGTMLARSIERNPAAETFTGAQDDYFTMTTEEIEYLIEVLETSTLCYCN